MNQIDYWKHWSNVRYEFDKFWERRMFDLVWHLPERLIYWSAIRLLSYATVGEYETQVVPDLNSMDALQRWSNDHGKV